MFQSGAQFMILVALVGLLLMRESREAPLRGFDEQFADFVAIHATRTEQPAPITLVGIDQSSLVARPWPWTPLDYALFFQSAEVFKPAAVATDEVLVWDARNTSPDAALKLSQYQKILREHLLRAAKVLTAARLGYPEDSSAPPALQETPVLRHVSGDVSGIPEFTSIEAQADEGFRLSSVTGFTNLPNGARYTRTVPLVLRYQGQVVPSFVLQGILLWEKLTPEDIQVVGGSHLVLAGRAEIPIDREGRMRVDFGVPRHRCGLDELVLASDQFEHGRAPLIPSEWFVGKFLLLARTDADARTLRFAPGLMGSPGELFAAAIGTIQNRSFIKRAPLWIEFGVIAVLMLIAGRCRRWRKRSTCLFLLVSVAGYGLLAITFFSKTLLWLPIVLPAGLAFFIAIFRLATPARASGWNFPAKLARR